MFYTDGNQVWNAQRQIMPNGQLANHNPNTLLGYIDNARAVIIPNINNQNQYYVVVSDHVRELNTYSVVDMSLDEGKGDIVSTQKMIPFTSGNFFYDFKATGTDSCGGIWLIGIAKNIGSKIFNYKVSANGISTIPQISNINNTVFGKQYKTPQISQDGTIYSVTNTNTLEILFYKLNLKSGWFDFIPFNVFKFKNLSSTGISFNYVDVTLNSLSKNNTNYYLVASFNQKRAGFFIINSNPMYTEIQTITSTSGLNAFYGLARKAPYNKLYFVFQTGFDTGLPIPYTTSITSHNLAVINNPDGVGTNVGYDFNGITFPGDAFPRVPYQGLVNYYGKPQPRPKITLPSQVVCADVPFVLRADVSSLPGVASGYEMWRVNGGDVVSFNATDSYTINTPGVYQLSFQHKECIEYTTITVTSPLVANVPPKDTLCEGQTLLLTTTGSVFVANAQNQAIQNPVSEAGVFSYTFAGCNTVSGGFELTQINNPKLQMPNSVLGCSPNVVTISPSFSTSLGQNLRWSNDSSLAMQTISTSGLYVLTISNLCFTQTDSTRVYYYDIPKIKQPTTDTLVCAGQKIVISANYPMQLNNENGTTSTVLGITKAGNYTINVSNACFTTTSSLALRTVEFPRFTIPTDTIVCDNTIANITVISNKNPTTNITWSDGTTENIRTITQNSAYEIEVKNACGTFKKVFAISFATSGAGFSGTNVFTPNGDGINDTWQPLGEATNDYRLQIYNRYGTLVFETQTWNQAWNASASPDGVYFFSISYTDCNKQQKYLKGTVMVVR